MSFLTQCKYEINAMDPELSHQLPILRDHVLRSIQHDCLLVLCALVVFQQLERLDQGWVLHLKDV